MKLKGIFFSLILVLQFACRVIKPELRYTPKNSSEFYFPSLSDETRQKKAECLELENYPCVFEQNDTLSDFVNTWYSTHLASMKEPILYNQIGQGKKVIRFTHLGTWSNPISYRIEKIDGEINGTYNKTKGLGGYDAGRRIKHEKKVLDIADWNSLKREIDSTFWNIQTHDTNMITDGAEWILEVLIDNKYHIVSRNSPDVYDGKEFAELCESVMDIYKK